MDALGEHQTARRRRHGGGGEVAARRRDVVTSASFTSKDWITKLEMDSVSIPQRPCARHGGARYTVVHQFTN